MALPPLPPVPPLTSAGFTDPVWARWLNQLRSAVGSISTAIVINTGNGFTGSVSESGGTSTITLGITVTGMLKGSGGGIVAAVPYTDYAPPFSALSPLTYAANVVSLPQATSTVDGYLSHGDWSTFNSKISGNQTITLSGDATGSGTTAIPVTLVASGVTAGTYGSATTVPQITVDAKGRITVATAVGITGYTPLGGITSARPASPALYTVYFDTTLGQPIWCKSLGPAVWVNSAGVVV